MYDFKNIHIGDLISQRIKERGIENTRICNFLHCEEKEIQDMYDSKSLDTEILLRWSKLLQYDFFRIYTQHLVLYAPPGRSDHSGKKTIKTTLPQFRKNIYTKEVIHFILEQISIGEKTRVQIIEEYGIPKTTLYKWISKYQRSQY